MRRPLSILATVGIVVMCALNVIGVMLPVFIPTSQFIYIGGVGPLGFRLYRFGIYVMYQNVKWFNFSMFLPAALIGGPSLVYLMRATLKDRRRGRSLGFEIVQDDDGQKA
jgi:hypothetical protein